MPPPPRPSMRCLSAATSASTSTSASCSACCSESVASTTTGSASSTHASQTQAQPDRPVHITTPRPSLRQGLGHVRCLGWENLAMPFAQLSEAATATLDALGVPYTVEARVLRALPDGSSGDCPRCDGGPSGQSESDVPGLASAYTVMPPLCELRDASLAPLQRQQPCAGLPLASLSSSSAASASDSALSQSLRAAPPVASSDSDSASALSSSLLSWGGPLAAVSRPLVVSLQICAAEADDGDDELHHVDVRRQQGEHWYFQDFYARFRSEFSRRLGMQDYTQLSQFSPMQPRRKPVSHRPAAGWAAVVAPTAPAPAAAPWSATATATAAGAAPVRTSPLASQRLSPRSEPGAAGGAPAIAGSGRVGSFKRVGKPGSCAGLMPSPTSSKMGRRPLP